MLSSLSLQQLLLAPCAKYGRGILFLVHDLVLVCGFYVGSKWCASTNVRVTSVMVREGGVILYCWNRVPSTAGMQIHRLLHTLGFNNLGVVPRGNCTLLGPHSNPTWKY